MTSTLNPSTEATEPKAEERGLSVSRIRELFDYNPVTGELFFVKNGKLAGSQNLAGRVVLRIDGVSHYASRVCWAHYYGVWPTYLIDHDNGMVQDNRIKNLFDRTQSQNMINQTRRTANKSGVKGVDQVRSGNWRARLAGVQLGTFATKELAQKAVEMARERALNI